MPFLPLNSLYTPWVEQENFRLTDNIPLPREGMRLSLIFEAFNIANNWSPTGLTTQMFTEAKGVLTYTPTAFNVGSGMAGSRTARRRAVPGGRPVHLLRREDRSQRGRRSLACLFFFLSVVPPDRNP